MRSPKLLPLALLALNEEGQIEGITRFQKLVFMAQMEIDDLQTRKYEFDSYKYGPFSKELYDDLDRLARNGYINRSVEKTGNENEKHIYSITEKGSDYIFQILERDSTQDDLAVEDLRQLKEEYNDMPILQLIRLIYNQHPEYAKDSKLDV
ncbi:PadR family transcriptional regulator [Halalkalicoccus subterraneus]|uniref:PadR family transcriptional regulator n=1 Tax=Halalkalicoccus subterraneus TaxID=2675002 RepID=UPI0013CEC4F4|nr:PadR family transcriptional regulator [Halalkalicoccus subterraneus]